MKALYIDLSMGAAGDMLCAALLDTLENPEKFIDDFNALGLSGVSLSFNPSEKRGVKGLHMRVLIHGFEEHEHSHSGDNPHGHRGLKDIIGIISALKLPEAVRDDAIAVYEAIAHAESLVHGESVGEVHFHEVGALDAIADVVAFSMLFHRVAPEKTFASPVHVGCGIVKCAHGILPVPAPATARLLESIPHYGGTVQGELCTPTGAALLKHYVNSFGTQPAMKTLKTGFGMGLKDYPIANCVRAIVGEM